MNRHPQCLTVLFLVPSTPFPTISPQYSQNVRLVASQPHKAPPPPWNFSYPPTKPCHFFRNQLKFSLFQKTFHPTPSLSGANDSQQSHLAIGIPSCHSGENQDSEKEKTLSLGIFSSRTIIWIWVCSPFLPLANIYSLFSHVHCNFL